LTGNGLGVFILRSVFENIRNTKFGISYKFVLQ
jgi:hypothetical protein